MKNTFLQPNIEPQSPNDYHMDSINYITRSLLVTKPNSQNNEETNSSNENEYDGNKNRTSVQNTDTVNGIAAVCLQNLERNMQLLGLELSSRHFSWTDMRDLPNIGQSSISNKAGFYLKQHLFNMLKSESVVLPDPSPNTLLSTINELSLKQTKNKRMLFMLVGQGLPQYTDEKEKCITLWPTKSEPNTKLSFSKLINAFSYPSCFIIDADYAGVMYNDFASENLGNPDRFGFFSCGKDEMLPHRVGLPSDLFSSCMLTPAFISILFGSRQFYAFKLGGLHELSLDDFSETSNNMPLLNPFSFVITKLLNVLVKAMAASTMDPLFLYNTFYRDKKVGHFYVNFCLARRIGLEIGFHPISYPQIPDFSTHKLWGYMDMYIDRVLLKLIPINEPNKLTPQQIVSQDMTKFLSDALVAVEHGLTQMIGDALPNELSMLPMILEDPALFVRGLTALTQFIDSGKQAMYQCICMNIIDCLINAYSMINGENKTILRITYCIAKLLCFSYIKGENLTLFTSSPYKFVQLLLQSNQNGDPLFVIIASILTSAGLAIDIEREVASLSPEVFGIFLSNIQTKSLHARYWVLLFISLLLKSESISIQPMLILQLLQPSLQALDADVRAVAINAFTSLIEYSDIIGTDKSPKAENKNQSADDSLSLSQGSFSSEPSPLIQSQESDEDEEEGPEQIEQFRKMKVAMLNTFKTIVHDNSNSASPVVRMQVLFLLQTYIINFPDKDQLETDTTIVDSLSLLSTDPQQEICAVAIPLIQSLYSKTEINEPQTNPLLINAFETFLSSNFEHLKEDTECRI